MKLSYVQLGGEKHPACFSLSAIEAIEDEFGSLDKMREDLASGSIKAINSVLEIMLDAGRAYCTGMGMDLPPKLKCRPADLIDVTDTEVVHDIFAVISGDSERSVEVRSKNA